MVLGCDIGNAFGYASLLLDESKSPESMLSSPDMRQGMPTTVHLTPPNGEPIEAYVFSGSKPAELKYRKAPKELVRAVKMQLLHDDGKVKCEALTQPPQAERVYAVIVRDLVRIANQRAADIHIRPVYDLVFTYPASFQEKLEILNRMQNAIESVTLDGHKLHVVDRLPEPAAVALDYLHFVQYEVPKDEQIKKEKFTALVYDLGYGTFDTALVSVYSKIESGKPYELHRQDGSDKVAGRYFDEILIQEIRRILREKYNYTPSDDADEEERIRTEAVRAKHELTTAPSTVLDIRISDEEYAEVEISRERFEKLSEGYLDISLGIVDGMLDWAQRNSLMVDAVVLSGGGSRMPMIKRSLEEMLEGRIPVYSHRHSEAVSFGAARFGYRKDQVLQRTRYNYGMVDENSLNGSLTLLIKSGVELPAESEPFTYHSSTTWPEIKIYRSKDESYPEGEFRVGYGKCQPIMWFPFKAPKGKDCKVKLKVLEDDNVEVFLSYDGKTYVKSTKDELGKILD